jgi:hypothetical protein
MAHHFTGYEQTIIKNVATYVDEVFTGERHGKAQSFYVIHVDKSKHLKVPPRLLGYWKTSYPTDLTEDAWGDMVVHMSWIKCKQVEKTVFDYPVVEEAK